MEFTFSQWLFVAGALALLSVFMSRVTERVGVPALLGFLGLGMMAGSDGVGGIWFDNPHITQEIGILALASIIFMGGIDSDWGAVRRIWLSGVSLATLGVVLTALVVGFAMHVLTGMDLMLGLLLGSLVSSTDAAAVLGVLRSGAGGVPVRLRSLLEFESASNDPIAVLLTVALLSIWASGGGVESLFSLGVLVDLMRQIGVGVGVGLGIGYVAAKSLTYAGLIRDFIKPIFSTALVLFSYGTADLLQGNGFLAVYIVGLALSATEFAAKKRVMRFHDNLAWIFQISLFLLLGLLVFPSKLPAVAYDGLVLSGVLVLLARPIAVFISLSRSALVWREKLFISWVGLRGAVPIILATFPLVLGHPQAWLLFHMVFFAVFVSVLCQGSTLRLALRWCRISD